MCAHVYERTTRENDQNERKKKRTAGASCPKLAISLISPRGVGLNDEYFLPRERAGCGESDGWSPMPSSDNCAQRKTNRKLERFTHFHKEIRQNLLSLPAGLLGLVQTCRFLPAPCFKPQIFAELIPKRSEVISRMHRTVANEHDCKEEKTNRQMQRTNNELLPNKTTIFQIHSQLENRK